MEKKNSDKVYQNVARQNPGKEIKTRKVRKDIKALDKTYIAAERIKRAYVKTKESAEQTQPQGQNDSTPVGYAENKIRDKVDKAAHETVYQAKKQGGRFAHAIKEKQRTAKELKRVKQQTGEMSYMGFDNIPASSIGRRDFYQPKEQLKKSIGKQAQPKGAGVQTNVSEFSQKPIKIREYGRKTIKSAQLSRKKVKNAGKGTVKAYGKTVKTAEQSAKATVKTTEQAVRAAQATATTSVKMAQKSAKAARLAAKETGKAIKTTVKAAVSATKAIIAGTKALITAIAAGGWIVVMILIIVLLFGGIISMIGGDNSETVSSVSKEVQAYEPVIQRYATEYGVGEYVELIKAVMMQESGGKGNDPMQSSQSSFNKKYDRKANGITAPEYSIQCGIQELRKCLADAEVENPLDMQHIKLALQGYNYGNGYISWANKNYGGYTAANAIEFSDIMAEKKGWDSYGDKQYVPHVLRYYAFGRIPMGIGNQAIVQVALTQEGNRGDTYWSWYGFNNRVEWCACFVSWCSEQCGYLESGVIPKFSLCSNGAEWFISKGQFQDGSYVPAAGDIIFFDWKSDGTIDHVGIVESVTNGIVNTIEGNSKDKVARRSYPIGSNKIYGYGVPQY